jgi:hypothetical protein
VINVDATVVNANCSVIIVEYVAVVRDGSLTILDVIDDEIVVEDATENT